MANQLNSYQDVQAFFNSFLRTNGIDVSGAPHGAFWNSLKYDQFVNGDVPGVAGVKILVKGNAAQSNIVAILKNAINIQGVGTFERMPAGGPFMSDDLIASLADWIDRNCPNSSSTSGSGSKVC